MTDQRRPPVPPGTAAAAPAPAVDTFLDTVRRTPVRAEARGRLLFGLDATASRQPTWDLACQLQMDMFLTAAELGGLSMDLCYFRGHREFARSGWTSDGEALARRMSQVRCRAGLTQFERLLRHAMASTRERPVSALVLIGDSVEEDADALCGRAGELGLLGTPIFAFHEGRNPHARRIFQQLARASNGAFAPFDPGASDVLKALLSAVAVFASGGRQALENLAHSSDQARLLLQDLR